MKAGCYAIWAIVAIVNALSFFLVRRDKRISATRAGRRGGEARIPEQGFFALAVLGGWVLGVVAMMGYRHKTRSPKFLIVYVLASAVGTAALAGWLSLLECW